MSSMSGCVFAALCLLLVAGVWQPSLAEDSVQIRQLQYDQLVTSSTLNWVPGMRGNYPNNSVVGAQEIPPDGDSEEEDPDDETETPKPRPELRSLYVCRARSNGMWVPGELHPELGYCLVSLLGDVLRMENYQVLQNTDDGARLSWLSWDRFIGVAGGAVASDEVYVARRKVESGDTSGFSHYIGTLDPKNRFGRLSIVTREGEEKGYQDGEVLVETEPVRYELSGVKFINRRKRVNRQQVVLTTGMLRNGAATIPVEVDEAMQYSYKYSLYWGQGRATLKGLPTVVRHHNGSLLGQIEWGLEEEENRPNVFPVKHLLDPGTAVNVTLLGNNTETEMYYIGKLVAFFQDGDSRARSINGSRREVDMLDVRAEYSSVYYIKNNSLVPTTTTTTTTTTTPPTTTTTTTPVPAPQPPSKKPPKPIKPDSENEINRGMLADQALALEKDNGSKQERGISSSSDKGANTGTAHSTAATFLIGILATVVVVQRIT